jgi:prepilin-type N-terminal cleavage/methylation domain-containing protein
VKLLKTRPVEFRRDMRGFTLPEVMITIVILGILFAIASSTWQSVVESRQVDSATNQLTSDLRLAHSKATNQLKSHQVVLTNDSSSYQVGPAGSLAPRTLPDGVKVSTSLSTIEFKPDGSATGPTGAANEIVVSKTSPPTNPQHGITINPATSRVKVD